MPRKRPFRLYANRRSSSIPTELPHTAATLTRVPCRQAKQLIGERDDKIRKLEAQLSSMGTDGDSLEASLLDSESQLAELRAQCASLSQRTEKAESRMNEELLARKKERKRAEKAEQRGKDLEEKVKAYEAKLQKAADGMGMMRTIAKIRNLDDETCAVGFDAVGERTLGEVSKSSGKRGAGRPRQR